MATDQSAVKKDSDWQDYAPPKTGGDSDWQDYAPSETSTPKQPGALERFTRSFRSSMGFEPEGGVTSDIKQVGSGFKQMAGHPIESAKLLASGIVDPMQQTAEAGLTRMKKPGFGNKVAGGAEYLESGIPLVGPWLASAGHQFESGDIAGGMGTMAPGIIPGLAEKGLRVAGPAIRDVTPSIGEMKDYVGSKLRLPEATSSYPKGRLTPGTRAVARLLGAGAGHLTGIPGLGEFGGWVLGPGIADMLIPEHPNLPGPFAKLPMRMPKMGIEAVAKSSPFEPAKARFVEKFAPPEPNKIIQPGTPEAQAPHVEGSYWSFKEPALRKAVMGGDRDAAIVYKQRFGGLPEGARFLTDVAQGPTRGLYRSR